MTNEQKAKTLRNIAFKAREAVLKDIDETFKGDPDASRQVDAYSVFNDLVEFQVFLLEKIYGIDIKEATREEHQVGVESGNPTVEGLSFDGKVESSDPKPFKNPPIGSVGALIR